MIHKLVANADESTQRPDGTFFIQMVKENDPGYIPFGRFPSLKDARTFASDFNNAMGFTPDEVLNVRVSSMNASGDF